MREPYTDRVSRLGGRLMNVCRPSAPLAVVEAINHSQGLAWITGRLMDAQAHNHCAKIRFHCRGKRVLPSLAAAPTPF
jgi:hypothetical protein